MDYLSQSLQLLVSTALIRPPMSDIDDSLMVDIYLFSIQIHSQYKKSHVLLHDSFQNYLLNFATQKRLATEVTRPFDKNILLLAKEQKSSEPICSMNTIIQLFCDYEARAHIAVRITRTIAVRIPKVAAKAEIRSRDDIFKPIPCTSIIYCLFAIYK